MLKYKLKNNCVLPTSTQPIKDYLYSLGIKKVESFLNQPSIEDELSPQLLTNINNCIEKLHEGFESNKKFFIIVDCDADGYTSSAIFYRYFKLYYPNSDIRWVTHEGKEHGLEKDKIDQIPDECDYIIIPDAGSAQLEEQQILLNKGKTIIIIDHHMVDKIIEHPNLVVVNNQSSNSFENKDLSGAGVVLKVIQAYATRYPNLLVNPNQFYDLAALGILSDMMSTRSLDNNYIIWQGLHNIRNKMFKALLEQQSFSISDINNPTKIDTVFYITPIINGVIRAGTQEEKNGLFYGFIEEPYEEIITTEYKGVKRNETFYQYFARLGANARTRQNNQKEKCMKFLKERIEKQGYDKNKIVIAITSKDDKISTPQTITGLVAMDLLKEYGKPTLVLRPKNEEGITYLCGSGRGKQADGFDSFLMFMRGSKYCCYAEGHDMAFGASIKETDLENFIQECNERLADIDFGTDFIEVDAIFNENNINITMLKEFAQYKYIYGNAIPQPLVVINGIIDSSNVRFMGAEGTSVRINFGGISCIKYKDKKLVEQICEAPSHKVTVIGRPQLNEWMGTTSTQLMIDYIELTPAIKASKLF